MAGQPFMTINLGFDAASLSALMKVGDFESILAAQLMDAHAESLDEMKQAAQAEMMAGFMNPTGKMETSWRQGVTSPKRSWLRNTAPYSQRREYGFSGLYDSLNRFYPFDPGIMWAHNAVELAEPVITEIFTAHVRDAMNEVAL